MPPPSPYETLFVARQPVLDSSLNTWGYFHYYRRCVEHTYSEFTDPLLATLSVIQCLPACIETCSRPHKALIHLPPQALLTGIPRALGPECVVPVLDPFPADDPKYVEALRVLRSEGYSFALDLPRPADVANPLLEVAGTVILDLRAPEGGKAALAKAARALLDGGHTLLAKRVETHEAADLARSLGMTLFAGHFFREPVTLSQRKISSAESTRLALLDLLCRNDPPMDKVILAIEADASVSYRVLSMLNSPHFGLLKKVSSVRQAVLLAGWVQLSAWLRVMALGDLSPTTKARELLHLSAQRAKFLELLGLAANWAEKAESLFLLGLFSLLPTMLETTMREVLEAVSLDDQLRAALLGESGPYSGWLDLAQAIEDTRWEDMGRLALDLGLPTGSVSSAYNASFQWADTLLLAMPERNGG